MGCVWTWPTFGRCGNGVAEEGELCDATDFAGIGCPDLTPYSGGHLRCTESCRIDTTGCHDCGNGVTEGPEPCDATNLGGETCLGLGFDGGELACRADCLAYDWSGCIGCGDGEVQGDEACDDANFEPGDGCDERCQVEPGWACSAEAPSVCTAVCGDALVVGPEACDGENLNTTECGDLGYSEGVLRCAADCLSFDVAGCSGQGCGNGAVEGSEACDDGNTISGDGCDASCNVEPGWTCDTMSPSVCLPICGDGVVIQSLEGCDDGGSEAGDGCDAQCQVESGWSCVGAPSVCSATCGDGIAAGAEMCDGNDLGGYTCATFGFTGGAPQCAPGCDGFILTGCSGPGCGNGVVEGSEACDDGNTISGDGCSALCEAATCGDGVVEGDEACDDGNTTPGDGCDASCQLDTLIVQPGPADGKDAQAFSLNPNTPYGDVPYFMADCWTYGTGTHHVRRNFLEFPLPAGMAGCQVASATLYLYHDPSHIHEAHNGADLTTEIARVTQAWQETSVTWNAQPAVDAPSAILLGPPPASDSDAVLDVTPIVSYWFSNPGSNHGFRFSLGTEDGYRRVAFTSSDFTDDPTQRPMLAVTFSSCP